MYTWNESKQLNQLGVVKVDSNFSSCLKLFYWLNFLRKRFMLGTGGYFCNNFAIEWKRNTGYLFATLVHQLSTLLSVESHKQ